VRCDMAGTREESTSRGSASARTARERYGFRRLIGMGKRGSVPTSASPNPCVGRSVDVFVLFFISLFSIVNPLSAIPTFVSLTGGIAARERRRMITQSSLAVFVILMVSYLAGQGLLAFFSIRVASLRVAGGFLIFSMAWSMLQARISPAKQTPEEAEESSERHAIAIVPLAMPLLAGPGAISLMIIQAGRMTGVVSHLGVAACVLALSASIWVTLQAAGPIARALGTTGMNVATRFMGLILAAIAVEFITSGLAELFPGWTIGG
jgi:multiple antibiotic resistance protein